MANSVFKIGRYYTIWTMNGSQYSNAYITNIDPSFIEFVYKNGSLWKTKILSLSLIANANEAEDQSNIKVWYFTSRAPCGFVRWGIDSAIISKREFEINKEKHIELFTDEKSAKEYLFSQVKNYMDPGVFFYGPEDRALYFNKEEKEWYGPLVTEYFEWANQ